MTTAPTAGPTIRARLKPLELRAIASWRSSRPTSSTMSDWRAGISKALNSPPHAERATSHPMVMCPDQVNAQRSDASTRRSDWATFTTRSLSARSTTTPAWREKRMTGTEAVAATSPTTNALSLSSSASHPRAMDCIQVPISEIVCPLQKMRKFRCCARTRKGLRERPGAGMGRGSEARRERHT
jgi:hypothetical protein